MLCCAAVCVALALGQAQESSPAEKEAVRPTPAQMAGIEAFWREALHEEALDGVKVIGEALFGMGMPAGSLRATAQRRSRPGTVEIEFEPVHGMVWSYSRYGWTEEPGYEGRTHKDAVPVDTAWERAAAVLRHYGLSTDRSGYEVLLDDPASLQGAKDDLYGACWMVRSDLKYKGMPCRGANISIRVSAVSGELATVTYKPVLVPRVEYCVRVSKAEAIEKVRAWLEEADLPQAHPLEAGAPELKDIQEVIALPYDPGLKPGGKGGYGDTGESFYCWEVPYRYSGGVHPWNRNLWVRVDTGDIIGGF